jgi:hypothetical protein
MISLSAFGLYLHCINIKVKELRKIATNTSIPLEYSFMVMQVKVKLFLCLIKRYAMKAYGEVDVQTHVFLTSALVGGKW